MNLALANAAFHLFVNGRANPAANKWRWPCTRVLYYLDYSCCHLRSPPGSHSANFRKLVKTSNLEHSWFLFVGPHVMTFSLETGLVFK